MENNTLFWSVEGQNESSLSPSFGDSPSAALQGDDELGAVFPREVL